MNLQELFCSINQMFFDNLLDCPQLTWNHRFRVCAGRFIPGKKRGAFSSFFHKEREDGKWFRPPEIEIASYFLNQENAKLKVMDTLGHEMIHYWLWTRKKPYGHTTEFFIKMKSMGVSRYNSFPQRQTYRYLYLCPVCKKQYPAIRIWKKKNYSCGECCRIHHSGKYHVQFQLLGPLPFTSTTSESSPIR